MWFVRTICQEICVEIVQGWVQGLSEELEILYIHLADAIVQSDLQYSALHTVHSKDLNTLSI